MRDLKSKESELLWTEKYRPTRVDELDLPDYLKCFCKKSMENSTFPNLLLFGPPGTGKSTFANLIGKAVFGNDVMIKEFNSSDERGISVIRESIKELSKIKITKIIILDECENLTKDSQTCLRRILEDYCETTKFIFCTNYLTKIIDPLKSRLLKFKFKTNSVNTVLKIFKHENIQIRECLDSSNCVTSSVINQIYKNSNGDLRKTINTSQSIMPIANICQTENQMMIIANVFMGKISEDMLTRFLDGLNIKNYRIFIDDFLMNSFSVLEFLYQLIDVNDKDLIRMYKIYAECEYKLYRGCSNEVVLNYLCLNKLFS